MYQICPCCKSKKVDPLITINEFDYYRCLTCDTLFIDIVYLTKIDNGYKIVKYEEKHWKMELEGKKQLSYGPALARLAEAIYYCKRPIKKFLDIGTGPGYLLDAINKLLPNNADVFYGVELYPPDPIYRTKAKNYIIGDLGNLTDKYDCGICIEVIQHLTPTMLNDIFKKLAGISNPDALYIFNTGMPEYVLKEDMGYLEPTKSGHIVSYSHKAISLMAAVFGFRTHKIIGKTWAFALEFVTNADENIHSEDIRDRRWHASEHNLNILSDANMGSVLKVLGLETSRAYN